MCLKHKQKKMDGQDNQAGEILVIRKQMRNMEKLMNLQTQAMAAQTQLIVEGNAGLTHPTLVKNVKMPEGRYAMSLSEFRTFRKDCYDFKQLTHYTD